MTTSCEDLVYTTSNSKFRVATKRQIHLKKAGLRPEIKIVSNFLKRAKKKFKKKLAQFKKCASNFEKSSLNCCHSFKNRQRMRTLIIHFILLQIVYLSFAAQKEERGIP